MLNMFRKKESKKSDFEIEEDDQEQGFRYAVILGGA
jgi:hypothetical protein